VEDKRVHPRVGVHTAVWCERSESAPFQGLSKDISIGGMFIESTEILPFASEITIRVQLPGTKAELRLPAIVRWMKPTGFGVQFGALGARETHAISQLLKR
jgi:Tfp pilus assembly protein PilZ